MGRVRKNAAAQLDHSFAGIDSPYDEPRKEGRGGENVRSSKVTDVTEKSEEVVLITKLG